MVASCRPLIEVFAGIPDHRQRRGKRHPLAAILALVCVATLCGYRSYSAMAQWARIYPRALVRALGFTHPTPPCAATLCAVLRRLGRERVEAALGAWAEGVLARLPPAPAEDEAVAADGKTLRGSRRQGAPQAHLLSALSHRLGLTLGQRAAAERPDEITQIVPLLRGLVLEGRVFTMDALLTQRMVAQTIVEGKGDYVMLAKANQPRLAATLAAAFAAPPGAASAAAPRVAEQTGRGHGRLERRHLAALTAGEAGLGAGAGWPAWPGLRQVFRLEREALVRATGTRRREVVYGLTSLAPGRADAARLLRLTRAHWRIENRSHWVRDVTFDEDRSQVRCGSTPEVMAAMRNLAIGLLRVAGESNIAAACRRLAAQPQEALALLGIGINN
jgi:predicted transposase YbfD/YdcC